MSRLRDTAGQLGAWATWIPRRLWWHWGDVGRRSRGARALYFVAVFLAIHAFTGPDRLTRATDTGLAWLSFVGAEILLALGDLRSALAKDVAVLEDEQAKIRRSVATQARAVLWIANKLNGTAQEVEKYQ